MAGPRNSIECNELVKPNQPCVSPFDALSDEEIKKFLSGNELAVQKLLSYRKARKEKLDQVREELGITVRKDNSATHLLVDKGSPDSW